MYRAGITVYNLELSHVIPFPGGRPVDPPEQALVEVGAAERSPRRPLPLPARRRPSPMRQDSLPPTPRKLPSRPNGEGNAWNAQGQTAGRSLIGSRRTPVKWEVIAPYSLAPEATPWTPLNKRW